MAEAAAARPTDRVIIGVPDENLARPRLPASQAIRDTEEGGVVNLNGSNTNDA